MLRVLKVRALEDYHLLLNFENGETRILDVNPFLNIPFYTPLKNKNEFKNVYVTEFGVEWANGLDISPHELYDLSE
jgi:hypothetical protein